jgi:hypothetical protein
LPSSGIASALQLVDFDAHGDQEVQASLPRLSAPRVAVFAGSHLVTIEDDVSPAAPTPSSKGVVVDYSLASGDRRTVAMGPIEPEGLLPFGRLYAFAGAHMVVSAQAKDWVIDLDASTARPLAETRRSPIFARGSWLVTRFAGSVDSSNMTHHGVELVRVAPAGSLERVGEVVSGPKKSEVCIHGCPDEEPHPIFTGRRAFVLFGEELQEITLERPIRALTSLPLRGK